MLKDFKVAIIGGGPGGLSAALYLARGQQKPIVFTREFGRTTWAVEIQNYLGFTDGVGGLELLEKGTKQAERYGAKVLREDVLRVEKETDKFLIITEKSKYEVDYVIIATGMDDVLPYDIKGMEDLMDKNFFHCMTCDAYKAKNTKVACIGHTNDTASAACILQEIYKADVTLFLHGKPNEISNTWQEKLKKRDIKIDHRTLQEFVIKDEKLHKIKFSDSTEEQFDNSFSHLGHTVYNETVKDLDVDMDPEGYIKVDFSTYETSIPNLFAVGPVNTGRDQAINSAGQGSVAAMEIQDREYEKLGLTTTSDH